MPPPSCSICEEFLFEPQVGTCGHSFCETCCWELKSTCPICAKRTKFTPNYQLRETLKVHFPAEYAEREAQVEGSVKAMLTRYKKTCRNFRIVLNDFKEDEKFTVETMKTVFQDPTKSWALNGNLNEVRIVVTGKRSNFQIGAFGGSKGIIVIRCGKLHFIRIVDE